MPCSSSAPRPATASTAWAPRCAARAMSNSSPPGISRMPSRIVAGIGLSHVPSVGPVIDRKRENEPAWKPLFDAYVPVREWLAKLEPDVAIVVYNDHIADFSFDKYPTFAIGTAECYPIADEGFGTRPLPEVPGDADFSAHLCESLIGDEFDLTVCQEMGVEHGFLVPMNLCFPHTQAGWPVKTVPLQVNVIQHPLPSARRCYRLGQALRDAVLSYEKNLNVVVLGTGRMAHQLQGKGFGFMNEKFDRWFLDALESNSPKLLELSHHQIMEQAGAEAVELIMWLVMRGALSPRAKRVHRHYYAPMTTGMGLITFEEARAAPPRRPRPARAARSARGAAAAGRSRAGAARRPAAARARARRAKRP